MDDDLGDEPHHHTGAPGCMGPVCAYDTPVIETIAKPALPDLGLVVQPDTRSAMHCGLDQRPTGVDLTALCNLERREDDR